MENLHSNTLASGPSGTSTQKYVDVNEIRDGVIVMKNGTLRSVLLVSSINFDLKSSEEQDTIIAQYQNFLNSLDFPVQIVISSRKLNLTPYLDYLKQKESQITNELLSFQLSEYRNFVKNLTEVSSIMSKFFYVVIPFSPVESVKGGIIQNFFGARNQNQEIAKKREMFETYKNQLWQRIEQVSAGLMGIGLKLTPLKTEELIEFLYNSYNPSTHSNTIIKDIDKIELR